MNKKYKILGTLTLIGFALIVMILLVGGLYYIPNDIIGVTSKVVISMVSFIALICLGKTIKDLNKF